MKTLVVFYSRSGNTRKAGEEIAKQLKADVEEIIDTKNRKGIMGYMRSGFEAAMKKTTEIKEPENNPSLYDIVIIGTPVWFHNMSSPVRTYLSQNKAYFKGVAFFCTMNDSKNEKIFTEMSKVCENQPLASMALQAKSIDTVKISEFIKAIKK